MDLSSWKSSIYCNEFEGWFIFGSNLVKNYVYCLSLRLLNKLGMLICRMNIWGSNKEGLRKRRVWQAWLQWVVQLFLQLDNCRIIFHGFQTFMSHFLIAFFYSAGTYLKFVWRFLHQLGSSNPLTPSLTTLLQYKVEIACQTDSLQ